MSGAGEMDLLARSLREVELRPRACPDPAGSDPGRLRLVLALTHPAFVPLTAAEIAELFRCTEDRVLRTPKDQLATYRVGRENLHFLPDFAKYLKTHCRVGTEAPFVAEGDESWLDQLADRVRGRSSTQGERR